MPPEVPEPPVPASVTEHLLQRGRVRALEDQFHAAVEHERPVQPIGWGDPHGLAVQPGSAAPHRLISLTERGGVHHAEDRMVVHRERDQGSPDLDPVGEVLRGVDGVDDPSPVAAAATLQAFLLAEDGVGGISLPHAFADHGLDG